MTWTQTLRQRWWLLPIAILVVAAAIVIRIITTPLEVRMTVHSREQDVQQAQMIQQMLDKIGIKLNLDVVERVAWGEKVRIQNDFQLASRQSGVAVAT